MNYKYSAINSSGSIINGYIEADGEVSARSAIRNNGLYLVSIKEATIREGKGSNLFFSWGVRQRLPVQLARQLASLLRGGVPLFQALTIISNQMNNQKEREILRSLKDSVKGGSSLSDALKVYPNVFDNLFIYSVAAGEKSGALDSILRYQADLLESRAAVRGKIRAALVYPAAMSVVGLGVLIFLVTFVVPMVTKIFDRMNQKLPLITKVFMSVTSFANNYLPIYIPIILIVAFTFVYWIQKTPKGRHLWDDMILHLPIFGNLYQMILVGRFAKILGTLLKSGVHMLQSLVVVSSTMKNTIICADILQMSRMIERGSDLSIALRETNAFPSYVADMVSVGESSGNVEEMLSNVAEYYENTADQKITAFTSMIEPLIIVILGAIVAVILVSIMLPLFEMNKALIKG
jgi:general secretion pathway protein F